jgi:hypothetical protein
MIDVRRVTGCGLFSIYHSGVSGGLALLCLPKSTNNHENLEHFFGKHNLFHCLNGVKRSTVIKNLNIVWGGYHGSRQPMV